MHPRSKGYLRAMAVAIGLCLVAAQAQGAEPIPAPSGPVGAEYVLPEPGPHLTEEQRREIQARIDHNIRLLRAQGKLAPATEMTVLLDWPLAAQNGLADFGFHGISNFVDQNPAFPDQLLDYHCGARTYDTDAGYNHRGIDFFTWPFPWLRMRDDQVAVVAAAPGTIVLHEDGHPDQSCGFNGNPWNAVYVQHADGSVAWYGHLKASSLTSKSVGETVVAGEYLGVMGSSGNSTGPHLHLEIRDSGNNLIEPYAGNCNSLNASSWWTVQRPYHDSAVNALSTGGSPASFPTCPQVEEPHQRTVFAPGDAIYFTAFYRDQLGGQVSDYVIYRPNGTIFASWSHSSPEPHYAASWWYWYWTSFPGAMLGTWTFEVYYEGQLYQHFFDLVAPVGAGLVPGEPPFGTPLTLVEAGPADVVMSWGDSCSVTDVDFAVYEGALDDFTSHRPVACSTGGQATAVVTPAPGNRYFLVAPHNGVREGSLGQDSLDAERPESADACLPRLVAACP